MASMAGRGPNRASRKRSSFKERAPGAAFSYSARSRINETITGTSARTAARILSSGVIAPPPSGVVSGFGRLAGFELGRFVFLRLVSSLGGFGLLGPRFHCRGQAARQNQSQRHGTKSH